MNCLKFFLQCRSQSYKEKFNRDVFQALKFRFYCTSRLNKVQSNAEEENFLKKIIYNEVLLKNPPIKRENNAPICLKYLMPENNETDDIKSEDTEVEKVVHFPYAVENSNDESNVTEIFAESVKNFTPADDETINVPQWDVKNYFYNSIEKPWRWASKFHQEEEMRVGDVFKFGSCNPNFPISFIPCGGCGALLHCKDPKLPGFIPAELFEFKKQDELRGEKCQRCNFLEKFNVALCINVPPSEYKKLISSVKEKEGLAIVLIDILDFPCSVFPEIFDLIGSEKPVIIAANKVDLLIQEGPSYIQNFKESLMRSLQRQNINVGNIKHVELISAKTGYGIERLINVLLSNWRNKGDIYLIGCTNVGKSSLFNTLIQSDLCKIKTVDLLQRATVSCWPGTTLNLLKFPIIKAFGWQIIARLKRLNLQEKEEKAFKEIHSLGKKIELEQIPLTEYVGRTFSTEKPYDLNNVSQEVDSSSDIKPKGINFHHPEFAKCHFCYDTPGVVHQDQIVNFLTAHELVLTVPKQMLLPRNFLLEPGSSLFIGGLARLDYVNGLTPVWFTVFASMELPLTVTKIQDAEEIYQKLLGTPYFRVPVSGKERLAKWPSLASKKFEIIGTLPKFFLQKHNFNQKKFEKEADADVVLSSAGWVAVNLPLSHRCYFEAWTPLGKGIHLRNPPLIKNGNIFRGPQIFGTPAFKTVMKIVENSSFTDPPES